MRSHKKRREISEVQNRRIVHRSLLPRWPAFCHQVELSMLAVLVPGKSLGLKRPPRAHHFNMLEKISGDSEGFPSMVSKRATEMLLKKEFGS